MGRVLIALTLATAMAASAPVFGQSTGEKQSPENPMDLLEDTARDIFRLIEQLIKAIPEYESPEVLENGDIIIRRIHPKDDPPTPPKSGDGPIKTKI